MAGKIKLLIDNLVEQRAQGNPSLESTTRTKLLLKGIDGTKYTASSDDDPAIIENRIAVYNKETAPVAEYYKAQGKYKGIHGIGTIEEISGRLYDAIEVSI